MRRFPTVGDYSLIPVKTQAERHVRHRKIASEAFPYDNQVSCAPNHVQQTKLNTKGISYMAMLLMWLTLFAMGCNWFGSPPVAEDEMTPTTDYVAPKPSSTSPPTTPDGSGALVEATALTREDEVAKVTELIGQPVTITRRTTIGDLLAASDSPLAVTITETVQVTETVARRANKGWVGQVAGDLVNLRGGPATNYPIIGSASNGESFSVLGKSEDGRWWQICCAGNQAESGWIFNELFVLSPAALAVAESIPVVSAPEPPAPAAADAGNNQGNWAVAAPAPGLPGNGGFGPPGGTNPLTGMAFPGGRGGQRPVIVCINNDFAARPQMGISQADVMVEYLMEGYGITRFSGVFYGDDVAQIGPIRSARLINSYMGVLFDAGLACSGASDPVRYLLKNQVPFPYLDVDLDDPSNARYTTNVGSDYRTRLRTDTAKLRRWLADWGAEKPASIRGFTFGSLADGGAPASTIAIPYPGGSASSYQYDGGGRYLRFLGGTPHTDGNTGSQLGLDNVIVQFVPHETTDIVEDSLGSLSIRLNLFGSGQAILFRDGNAFVGTWRSESGGDLPRLYSADGREIPLKVGRTWISIVPLSYTVSYQ